MLAQILAFLSYVLDILARIVKTIAIGTFLFIVGILVILLATLTALTKLVS